MTEDMDILISGGTLLTMNDVDEVISDSCIGIRDGAIRYVGTLPDPAAQALTAEEVIDGSDCLILPGLINTHTHLPMVCFRGMADDLPLMEWLHHHIFPAEAKHVSRDMVRHGSLLAMAEMILSGTTTFCDGYFFEGQVARAAMEMGMRGIVCAGVIDLPAPGNSNPSRNIEMTEAFIRKWMDLSPLLAPAVFCHSPYTCGPDTLRWAKEMADRHDILFLTHLSETREEVRIIRERYGKPPVVHLRDLGVLDGKTVAVHCNWLTGEEKKILADHGVRVSHNPESSMKLAAGIAPIPELQSMGVIAGLGTDGCASNNDLDMIREMGTAARIHKATEGNPLVMDAKTVLRMATIDAARVLGLSERIGSIEKGKKGDIILVDLRRPHLTPLYNPYAHLVHCASGADVTTTIIDGRVVMDRRRLRLADVNALMAEVQRIAEGIAGKPGGDPPER